MQLHLVTVVSFFSVIFAPTYLFLCKSNCISLLRKCNIVISGLSALGQDNGKCHNGAVSVTNTAWTLSAILTHVHSFTVATFFLGWFVVYVFLLGNKYGCKYEQTAWKQRTAFHWIFVRASVCVGERERENIALTRVHLKKPEILTQNCIVFIPIFKIVWSNMIVTSNLASQIVLRLNFVTLFNVVCTVHHIAMCR